MILLLRKAFNRALDRLVRPQVTMFHKPTSAFRLCGYAGFGLAVLLTMSLTLQSNLSPWVTTLAIVASVFTFLGLVMATKIATGEERIIYYHHEIAVTMVVALVLRLLQQPVLPYVDLIILGIGLFLFCGRIGCLMVGCCHGRPHRWGVCYRADHADAGFTPYYVGVRLFPIQAVESIWALCVVIVGALLVSSGHPPGTALAWYVISYGLGRFCFEFVRGDPDRPYYWGFSQPQWISLVLMCSAVWAELTRFLPFYQWHAVVTACVFLAMISLAAKRRFWRNCSFKLLHPHHIKEIAEAVESTAGSKAGGTILHTETKLSGHCPSCSVIQLRCTSVGVQISSSRIKNAGGDIQHYAISSRNGGMSEDAARLLVQSILRMKQTYAFSEFFKGNSNIYHLLIYPDAGKEWAC